MSYQLYKPLRNHLKQFALIPSLQAIWAYIQHFQFGQRIPDYVKYDAGVLLSENRMSMLAEWELAILAKELILNAPFIANDDLRSWNALSRSINKIKDLDNNTSKDLYYGKLIGEKILLHVYRIAHQQFHWQQKPNSISLTRYFKILSHAEVNPIVEAEYGIKAEQLHIFALGVLGMFMKSFSATGLPDLSDFGISKEVVLSLIGRLSSNFVTLKKEIASYQSYDQDFIFTLNPLLRKPFIHVVHNNKNYLLCPITTYLFRRLTEGVYYDICNHPAFSNAFGNSFQSYIGEAAEAAKAISKNANVKILKEQDYFVGRDKKASIDWIVTDGSATLFIECKAKKVRYAAKISLADTTMLYEDLAKMADFIIQAYKTLSDAERGLYSHWQPDQKPTFPIIVTLENWHILGPDLETALKTRVESALKDLRIDSDILVRSPYSICSTEELEHAIYVMSRVGINTVMNKRNEGEQRDWALITVLHNYYSEILNERGDLFPDAFNVTKNFAFNPPTKKSA